MSWRQVRGGAGIGKTALCRHLLTVAPRTVLALYVVADATETGRPFAIFSSILEELFHMRAAHAGQDRATGMG